jgi:DNA polymerase-1
MPLIPVLSDMELNGCNVSQKRLEEIGLIIDENIQITEGALRAMTHEPTLNFNSPDQVADLFYQKLGYKPPWQHTAKRPSVEAKFLEPLKNKYPIISIYLQYKGYQKLKGTYVDGLIKTLLNGRIYGSFNQDGTETSRLSASKPNLQNIPARDELGRTIRTAWIAPPGTKLVKADASQLELRMIAHWSQDPRMLDAFRKGRDIHMETTMLMYNDAKRRPDGKTANFQIVYGGGTKKNRELLEEAYPGVFAWITKASFDAVEAGSARTLFGRNRRIYELEDERPWMVEHGMRMAISTHIQGSSAEIIKILMRRVWNRMHDTEIKMVLQVHDELVFEVPIPVVDDFCQFLYKTMRYDELSLPFTVEVKVGDNWGTMKDVKELK